MEIVMPAGANKDFSIGEAYRFGWQATWANIGFLLGFMVLALVIQYLPGLLSEATKDLPLVSVFLSIFSFVINVIVGMGFVKTGLRLASNEKGDLSDLYAHWPLFLRFLGVTILSGLAVMGGFLLLIIPGIIIAIRLQFAQYLLVDKNTGVMESLKKSWEMTKGVTLKLFLFGLVGILINLAGFLCLIIGLLAAIPTTLIASAYVYKKFLSGVTN